MQAPPRHGPASARPGRGQLSRPPAHASFVLPRRSYLLGNVRVGGNVKARVVGKPYLGDRGSIDPNGFSHEGWVFQIRKHER